MHEVALAEAIWKQVSAEMDRHPDRRLLGYRLVVGKWSGADPESLEFAVGLMASESPWPDAKAHLRVEPLALVCKQCQREFEPEELNLACPGCGGRDVEPIRGQDLRLESLEVE